MQSRRVSVLLVLLLLLAAPLALHAESIGAGGYTVAEANSTFANASAYVTTVNRSAYLVFYPDLKQSYSYLDKAGTLLNRSPSQSILYSNMAVRSAKVAYANIGPYRQASAAAALVFTLFMVFLLYRFMKPVARRRRGKRHGRQG